MINVHQIMPLIKKYGWKEAMLGLNDQAISLYIPKDSMADFLVEFSGLTNSPIPRGFHVHTTVPRIMSDDGDQGRTASYAMVFQPMVCPQGKLLGQTITIPFKGSLSNFFNFEDIDPCDVLVNLKNWICHNFGVDPDFVTNSRPRTVSHYGISRGLFGLSGPTEESLVSEAEYLVSEINGKLQTKCGFGHIYQPSDTDAFSEWHCILASKS